MPTATQSTHRQLIKAAQSLARHADALHFDPPVTHVYNPLTYAWAAHRRYLQLCRPESTRVLFLGMNPGPWGMAQTGVPFGQVAAVRDWLGIDAPVGKPVNEHPSRPVQGFACPRSEVSGQRLWGLFRDRFGQPARFFDEHFVVNYCPLVFMEASARNRTPDKLPAQERQLLDAVCDNHLRSVIGVLQPRYLVGIGAYAEACLQRTRTHTDCDATVVRILHPSPASPAANRDWAGMVTQQLVAAGIWAD
jgi:single-strand selective monofunctional uracil DNA glycosylase